MATSEAVPFAKTGGLGDVCGALPAELTRLGHPTTLILPAYPQAFESGLPIEPTSIQVEVPIGGKLVRGRLLRSRFADQDVPVYLVEQPEYFDRDQLYQVDGEDYRDNCQRFVFFCRAVMESLPLLGPRFDVIHANDWQTALLPVLQSVEYRHRPGYEELVTLLTIHNLAYQGVFWHWDMELTGVDWKYFNWRQMEFHGHLNLLKSGLAFADAISTVSPRYAEEIQAAELGNGLEGLLVHRQEQLRGIINGVDYRVWNPATDEHLPARYDVKTFVEGKAKCKAALQEEVGLPAEPTVPLIGLVGRLVDQKGWDLLSEVLPDWLRSASAQWVILGTGQEHYHRLLSDLAQRYPQKLAVQLTFSNPLAHRIEAGADMFLMPSKYEPCGLNQLYSLKYGTVPVVRATGGLADTVTDTSPETLANQTATGFTFTAYTTLALSRALNRAVNTFASPSTWHDVVRNGMLQDWSWNNSARQYVALYQNLLRRSRSGASV